MLNKLAQYTDKQLIEDLEKASNLHNPDQLHAHLLTLASKVTNPDYSMRILMLCKSCKVKNPGELSGNQSVKDPISGSKYKNTHELIKNFLDEIKGVSKMANSFNLQKFSQTKPEDKKKKRGNPFRVLMGKIGKMLDHGLERRDIVRYLLKEQIWNEETIKKAIGIVKEYNKKKHRKKQVKAQTLMNTAEEWPTMNIDYSKRSTPELITSLCWLHSLDNFDFKKHSFDHEKVEDKSGVKSKVREIKSILLKRGMSEDALDLILK
jgi:hypothetical protein